MLWLSPNFIEESHSIAALSKFADAIVYYVENIDQAPDKNVTVSVFSNEFFSAYDILFNVWLPQAKDSKVNLWAHRRTDQLSYFSHYSPAPAEDGLNLYVYCKILNNSRLNF